MTLLLALALAVPLHPNACAPIVRVRGVSYYGIPLRHDVHLGTRLHGVRPGCNDVVGGPNEPDKPVTLVRIRGVDASLAVTFPGDRRDAYIASGLFPQVPSFPLHRAIYGTRRLPQECHRPHPDLAILVNGVVAATPGPGGLLAVRSRGRVRFVFVDAGTRLGFRSTRRLVAGTRVRVVAGPCGRKLVAVSVNRV